MNALIEWFTSRETREQYLLVAAGIMVLLFLFHALIWTPVVGNYEQTRSKLEQLKTDVVWMRKATREIHALQPAVSKSRQTALSNESMQTLIYRSAKSTSLNDAIKNTIPQGKNRYRIRLEQANFEALIHWIETLHKIHAINVNYLDISKSAKPGLVNTSITLYRTP